MIRAPFYVLVLALLSAAPAHAWDPFLVENDHVRQGNTRLTEGNAAAALSHYDRAARELPESPGVHLNRASPSSNRASTIARAKRSSPRASRPRPPSCARPPTTTSG